MMTNTLRLFSIELRRNAAIWFVPVIIAVSWWLLDAQFWTPFLWDSTNDLLQQSVVPFAGPAMAGIAAWVAGRSRRRGIDDLLKSTSRPATTRNLTLWAATACWGLLAYALFAVYMMGQTTAEATWGGPEFWPVAVAVLAILAQAAWGFLIGGLFPSRFTAPLVGIGALGLQQLAAQHREVMGNGSSSTWINQLAAHNGGSDQQALFYLGLTGVALMAIALRDRRSIARYAAFAITAALALGGGVTVWGEYPRQDWTVTTVGNPTRIVPNSTVPRNNFGQEISIPEWTPPDPVCKGSPVTVCTAPAYQPVLDEAISNAATMVEPLLGLPGVPMRIEDAGFSGGGRGHAYLDISRYADHLVAGDNTLRDGNLANEAQIAIRDWLLQRSGWPTFFGCENLPPQPPAGNLGWPTAETCAATERFVQLAPDEQRAWLEAHYPELRAGKLTLADLP